MEQKFFEPNKCMLIKWNFNGEWIDARLINFVHFQRKGKHHGYVEIAVPYGTFSREDTEAWLFKTVEEVEILAMVPKEEGEGDGSISEKFRSMILKILLNFPPSEGMCTHCSYLISGWCQLFKIHVRNNMDRHSCCREIFPEVK
jgi:hypothetical protein